MKLGDRIVLFDFVLYRVNGVDVLHDKLHVHNDAFEILHIVEGDGWLVIGDSLYPMRSGTICFINSVHLHCSRPKPGIYVRSKLAVNASDLERTLEMLGIPEVGKTLFNKNVAVIQLNSDLNNRIDRQMRSMSEYYASNTYDSNARIILGLMDILLLCYDQCLEKKPLKQNTNTLFSRTISYINENISSDLTIDRIAENNYVSKYYLCRMFKKMLGVSIMKYILNQRLTLAKEQLINSDMNCSNIAMNLGFSSFSYFCRVFKQQEGITPSGYRSLHRKQLQKGNHGQL